MKVSMLMKRKNNRLVHLLRYYRYEIRSGLMQLFTMAWIIGMGAFAIFVLLLWTSI